MSVINAASAGVWRYENCVQRESQRRKTASAAPVRVLVREGFLALVIVDA